MYALDVFWERFQTYQPATAVAAPATTSKIRRFMGSYCSGGV
jgi:hypothetical protein